MFERDAAEAEIAERLGTLGHLHPREKVQVLTGAVLHVSGEAVRDAKPRRCTRPAGSVAASGAQ